MFLSAHAESDERGAGGVGGARREVRGRTGGRSREEIVCGRVGRREREGGEGRAERIDEAREEGDGKGRQIWTVCGEEGGLRDGGRTGSGGRSLVSIRSSWLLALGVGEGESERAKEDSNNNKSDVCFSVWMLKSEKCERGGGGSSCLTGRCLTSQREFPSSPGGAGGW